MINIFVHGTFFWWTKINFVRTLFYTPLGLYSGKSLPDQYAIKETIYHLSTIDPNQFQYDKFYTFGWSGQLSIKARQEASKNLYNHILNLVKKHKNEKIRIITHSHGGNVALHLPNYIKDNKTLPFIIDELVLLACPVQKSTESLVKHNLFKKIYSFHSHIDFIQILDPQGLTGASNMLKKVDIKELFSKRHFKSLDKIVQANITIQNKPLIHIDFILNKFLKRLPMLLKKANKLSKDSTGRTKKQDLFINLN